jgi:coenzyme PQQ synthesis protein D (PqqD)
MSEITKATVLRRRSDVRYRRIEGEAVVLRQSAAEVLVLNEVGASVLDLADGRRPVGEWIDAIVRDYRDDRGHDVDRETVARDVLEFASEATEAGLLEPVIALESGEEG